jgi:type I restriction enzyme S subunit
LLKLKEVFSFLKKEGMMSEWREYKLKQLTIKIGSGATPRGGSNSYKEAGISLIRSQNVLDFGFSESGLAFIDEEQANQLKNVEVLSNDILLNITGDSVARCCIVPDKYLPARVNQHVSIIRLISEKANQQFIFYYLQYLKPELLISAEIGATRNAITKGMIEEIEISLPPLPEQRAIASILSSLDDKIDLLHRQNATLEKMAETLFRQWFVEEAGEEWEEILLGDLIEIKGGFAYKGEFIGSGDSLLLGMGCVSYSDRFLTTGARAYSGECPEKYLVKPGDLVIATRQQSDNLPILGFPAIVPEDLAGKKVIVGANLYRVNNNSTLSNYLIYLLLKTRDYKNHIISSAKGSTVRMITKDAIESYGVIMPPKEVIDTLEQVITPINNKSISIITQIRTLTAMRDSLLPKLMSGEVKVEFV